MSVEHLSALPNGFQLQEYRIDRILGYGGFGITYLATDTNLDKSVAIKEYLPNELAVRTDGSTVKAKTRDDQDDFRWGLDRFLDEARTLARFRHPNLVPVHRFFEAHGTAYMVMEYEPGESLGDILRRSTERAPEAEVRQLLTGVLSGLEAVHAAGFLHRDIKPSNIIIRPDGAPVLIDFGAARQAVGRRSRNITSIVTPGYAPLEQYTVEGNQGPWTDIYATGAVLYQIASGKPPPDATSRARNDPYKPLGLDAGSPYSQQLRDSIDWALRFDEENRPQTIAQWREALAGTVAVPPLSNNDQVTRLVSSDRQTVANSAGSRPISQQPVSQPSGRQSVLGATTATVSGPPPAGQTQAFPPPTSPLAAKSNRTVIIASVLGVVLLAAVGVGAYVGLKPGGTTPTPPVVADDPIKKLTDLQKQLEEARKKLEDDQKKNNPDPQKKTVDDPQKKTPPDNPQKIPDNSQKKAVEKSVGPADRSDKPSTDKTIPDDKSIGSGGNDNSKGVSPSDTSTRAATQAREAAVDAKRIAVDARAAATAARDKARIAREQTAPAARKAAGAGAKTVKLDSGATYTGNVVNDKRQGLGVLVTPKGYRYEGQWDNDGATGLGVSAEATGDRYEGEWKNGDRDGRGVYNWVSGQRFEGEYRNALRNGLGVLIQADGERQEVRWKDGKATGPGVLVFANRERYEGEFSDGKFDGRGVYTWPDGQRFEGSYKDDKRYGYGILYLNDGSRQSGLWDGTNLTKSD